MIEHYENKLKKRKEKWWAWHKANPKVWEKFEEYTFQAIQSGRKKCSSIITIAIIIIKLL